ncbi:hypothetical protein MMC13_006021 [Lambiella insularis]|nr:hypothetical protein [Lambiella insularis]
MVKRQWAGEEKQDAPTFKRLWKSAYYSRFVFPRACRIPGIRDHSVSSGSLIYSSRISRWLEDEHLVKRGVETDWKKQYKLRDNWARGSCDVSEIQIAEWPSLPTTLVQLHGDVVVTADETHGIRAWSMKGSQRLLATLDQSLDGQQAQIWGTPTSLAINASDNNTDRLSISVGFIDGRFGIYILKKAAGLLDCRYMHVASSNGMISAIAYAAEYLVTMTDAQLLSLYKPLVRFGDIDNIEDPPRLLASLKSHTAWPPLTLSVRVSTGCVVISVAYAIPYYLSGWSVGLQELRFTTEGTMIHSRLSSAGVNGFHPLCAPISGSSTPLSEIDTTSSKHPEHGLLPSLTKPTSLSYSHPYLLASHPDNTLILYLVQSNHRNLTIGSGSRLWGHTSSVSGAHVGDRGKAVSVSAHGGEIRIWELEGGVNLTSSRRKAAAGQASVQVRAERKASAGRSSALRVSKDERSRLTPSLAQSVDEMATAKGWVGFDEEKVVVLREEGHRSQALVVYDFS